jgi:hypothetical protein
VCCPGHHPLWSPIAGVQEGHIGSQAPVPANMGDSSTVDLGITHSHEAPPLVVDLDGTLTAHGTIPEGLRRLARERPWWLPRLLVALVRGRAACHDHLAHLVDLAPERLPYRPQVLAFLRAERAGGGGSSWPRPRRAGSRTRWPGTWGCLRW